MVRLPQLSGEAICRALESAGFHRASQRGSHVKMRHPDGRTAIVPDHREVRDGTLRSILRQAGLSREAFEVLVK
jgi:predicted RNA binding protein YcfA (HicA-like mRNA interferase family)